MYISIAVCARALTFYWACGLAAWTCAPGSLRAVPRLPRMGERRLNRGATLPNLDPDSQATDRVMDIEY